MGIDRAIHVVETYFVYDAAVNLYATPDTTNISEQNYPNTN